MESYSGWGFGAPPICISWYCLILDYEASFHSVLWGAKHDNSLRIQIILQINMTWEEKKCFDYYTKQTRLDVKERLGWQWETLVALFALVLSFIR